MISSAFPPVSRRGMTLVEIVAAVGILIVLISLVVGVMSRLPGAADRVRCTSNLRSLHVSFNSYLDDRGYWPQQPRFSRNETEKMESWWINEMKPYSAPEEIWRCPGVTRLGKIKAEGTSPRLHYLPTLFDAKPLTPKLWPTMPWLVEIGNIHGKGGLLVLPDGSVHDWDVYVEQFQR